MDFYKVLENLMKTRNLSIPEISRATGLSDSTLRSIISRKTKNISLEVAFKLSQGLNVSLEELNGEKEISTNIDKAIELSIEEKNHLEDLRKLNDMGKKKVITYTKDLIEMPKYIKETESDYLAPIAAHDDNLTDEEKAVMDQKINEYLKKHK
ncbi:helix-turn-helix domain-containing protein [Clostridium baratii]|uniref:helix-turn-helix domain-containing protein n=1 Tax=Clostridium baratii TaxID=1561 RepID=UPI00097FBD92|nr:helix-turn-helix domain-containing protein [Clostridium baratii]